MPISSPVLDQSSLASFEQWLASEQSGQPDAAAFQDWFTSSSTGLIQPVSSAGTVEPTWTDYTAVFGDSITQAADSGFQTAKNVVQAGAQALADSQALSLRLIDGLASSASGAVKSAASSIVKTAAIGAGAFVGGQLLALGFLAFMGWLIFFPHRK